MLWNCWQFIYFTNYLKCLVNAEIICKLALEKQDISSLACSCSENHGLISVERLVTPDMQFGMKNKTDDKN